MARRAGLGATGAIALVLVIILAAWLVQRGRLETDDAFVDGDVVMVAASAPGQVQSIAVADNALVASDAALAQIKPAGAGPTPSSVAITAPIAGYIARRSISVGDLVTPGQPLMAIISPRIWVTANFKETQIERIHPGQAAQVTLDAYPGLKLSGRVDSLQHASGQVFSLLPPENASGNFVKVVQRVPVKILLDAPPTDKVLGPGLSAHVRINAG